LPEQLAEATAAHISKRTCQQHFHHQSPQLSHDLGWAEQ